MKETSYKLECFAIAERKGPQNTTNSNYRMLLLVIMRNIYDSVVRLITLT